MILRGATFVTKIVSEKYPKTQQPRILNSQKLVGLGRCSPIPDGFQGHLLRRYLDPKNIPKTPSQKVFGCLGYSDRGHFQVNHLSFRGCPARRENRHQKFTCEMIQKKHTEINKKRNSSSIHHFLGSVPSVGF